MRYILVCALFLCCAYVAIAGTIRREKRGAIRTGSAASVDPAELARLRANKGTSRTRTRTGTRTRTRTSSRTRTGTRTGTRIHTGTSSSRTSGDTAKPPPATKTSHRTTDPDDIDVNPIDVNPPEESQKETPPKQPEGEGASGVDQTNPETQPEVTNTNQQPNRGVPGRPDIDENGVPGLAKVASVGAGANVLGVDAGDKLGVHAGNQGGGVRAFQGADISGVHPALRGWKPFGPEQRAGYDCGNIGIGQGVGLGPIGSINTGSIDLPLGSAFGKDKFGGKGCQTQPQPAQGQAFTSDGK